MSKGYQSSCIAGLPHAISTLLLCSILLACTSPGTNPVATQPQVYTQEIISKAYSVDRIYRSMQGPSSVEKTKLGSGSEQAELIWITGYRTSIVDGDTAQPISQDFMCHSNLNMDVVAHRKLFRWNKNISRRLFTLSQGQSEIEFPEGFGIPISSDEELSLTTQVLNLNLENQAFKVKHRVSIDYVRDRDLDEPMKPLFLASANGLVVVDGKEKGGFYNVETPVTTQHGPGCMVGQGVDGSRQLQDKFGRKFAGHWIVKPGLEVNKTPVTEWMALPFNTTVHYIAVHLHPFAESLELRDITADKSIFKTEVRGSKGKIGIEEVGHFSSVEGIQLYKDHQYELISIYNNTSNSDQDSMAVMFLYLRDQELEETGMPDDFVVSDTTAFHHTLGGPGAKAEGVPGAY